ncbi:MAG TPA: chorismate synthase [Deltaproteobacteria bacterium]|nr:MAG: chorismate synthase [Deltaproteobacteria bacterium GWA2_55_82]OGQ62439.1 MAG: chorismate synthase [Deltaproteobacteria bacterium RIFCSPLOWO2_02_FULL_55_12]OIJ75024.1 MAG: chorismate synthase [Deltaproteobacteria bacterium GWC2_55_46]HBG45445.1 chorismate synthase [Deltaproteobacteria bacterium]HCY10276.1 chorismate synthase [Deltaproteobacteria bacterium]
MLRYLTAGESHGPVLTAIVEGMPAGLEITAAQIDADLARRQSGYGRGARMKIEKDAVEITSGVRHGATLGSPVTLQVKNRDWENWKEIMAPGVVSPSAGASRIVTRPRPGHADLSGGLKYGHRDLRNVLERSSARETTMRVAAGALAKRLLDEFGIKVYSWVVEIGGVHAGIKDEKAEAIFRRAEGSEVRCPDAQASTSMMRRIDSAKKAGDSLGGAFEVVITGVPPGLGSYSQWDRKLNARLSFALMSIQAIKGVEVGMGFEVASRPGSEVHDAIFYSKKGKAAGSWWPQTPRFLRKTNNAGGIEGGMSNGEAIVLRAAMKPIPTLYKPLKSVDIGSKKPFEASVERSDVTAVPAAAVIAESVAAFEVANAFVQKFGGDSIKEIARNYKGYLKEIAAY